MRTSPDALLDEAIHLAESGQPDKARDAFTQLVQLDEENEVAWQWLSQLVENDDDRRVCLENLLTLNPENKEAAAALAQLDQGRAIRVQSLHYQQKSSYEDVWSNDEADLCGYCAGPIGEDDKYCPNCHKKLLDWIYRYEKASKRYNQKLWMGKIKGEAYPRR